MNLTRLHQCVLEIHLNQLNYSLQYHIQEYEQIESISGIPIFVLLLNIVNSIIKEGRIKYTGGFVTMIRGCVNV